MSGRWTTWHELAPARRELGSSSYDARAAWHRGREIVGSTAIPGLTTTVGDRERILEQLRTEFAQLQADLFTASGWRPTFPGNASVDEQSPIWRWWQAEAKPIVEEWQKFYADQKGSWFTRWSTDWDVYTGWQERLLRLREVARRKLTEHGHAMDSPDPVDIPSIPWRGLGDKTRKVATDVGRVVKFAAYTAIGVGAILVLKSFVPSSGESHR